METAKLVFNIARISPDQLDKLMAEAQQRGIDIHRLVAAHAFGLTGEDAHLQITDEQRDTTKKTLFFYLYGKRGRDFFKLGKA